MSGDFILRHRPSVVTIPAKSSILILIPVGIGLGERLKLRTRNRIGAINPTTQVDEPATRRAERKARQFRERSNRIALPASGALALDHLEDSLVGVEGLGASVLAGVDSAGFGSLDLSAAAPFLYDSLR